MNEEDELFAALYPALRRLAAVVRPPEVDADDLVQEALARALSGRPLPHYDNIGAYLRTSIVNIARNHRRSFARHPTVPGGRAEHDVPGLDVYPSDLADLRRLKPEERAVLHLSAVEGLGYDEIGRILGCNAAAARARRSRAKRRLRAELREEDTYDEAL